jgi:2-oxoisovalerate dehydrogenase E2 component (dihydrolipoyl transacylase)
MSIPPDEKPAELQGAVRPAPPQPTPVARSSAVSTLRANPEPRGKFYSPAVLRLASEHGVDLSALTGTGINGRVTRRDVERFLESPPEQRPQPQPSPEPAPAAAAASAPDRPARTEPAPAAGAVEYEVVTLSPTRRTIADRMKQSNMEAPQAWTMVEADVTALVARRQQERAAASEQGVELTLLPYFTAAVVETLREFPSLNARWEGDELRRYHRYHIGIAVSSDSGLVVPVIHNAGDLNIIGLARHIADLSERARARKLRIEDIEGGTFTVNNTGAFGSIASKPIVNYPQVAIVTMERATKRPVVVEGDAIAIRSMVNVCLSFDHRALDGHEAGGFLAALKARLEAAEM